MNKFFTAVLMLACLVVNADCAFRENNFTSRVATEYLTTLVLSDDMTMQIQHESWKPGEADLPIVEIINGTWSCRGNNLSFFYSNIEDRGVYRVVGSNPLGLNPEQWALYITRSDSLLGGLILTDFEI